MFFSQQKDDATISVNRISLYKLKSYADDNRADSEETKNLLDKLVNRYKKQRTY